MTERWVGRVIPPMVYGEPHVALPTPLADALIDLADAVDSYFMGAGGDTARVAGDALTHLFELRERYGI